MAVGWETRDPRAFRTLAGCLLVQAEKLRPINCDFWRPGSRWIHTLRMKGGDGTWAGSDGRSEGAVPAAAGGWVGTLSLSGSLHVRSEMPRAGNSALRERRDKGTGVWKPPKAHGFPTPRHPPGTGPNIQELAHPSHPYFCFLLIHHRFALRKFLALG